VTLDWRFNLRVVVGDDRPVEHDLMPGLFDGTEQSGDRFWVAVDGAAVEPHPRHVGSPSSERA
jgi:hypothetical protein